MQKYIGALLLATEDPNREVRENAVYSLMTIGYPLPYEKVADMILEGTTPSYRIAAINYLMGLKTEEIVKNQEFFVSVLVRAARDSKRIEVTTKAMEALALIPHLNATRALVDFVESSFDIAVVLRAIDVLPRHVRNSVALNTNALEIRETAIAGLSTALQKGKDVEIRCAAVRALGEIGSPQVAYLLLAALGKEKSSRVRGEIICTLAAMETSGLDEEGINQILKVLEAAISDTNSQRRNDVIEGLVRYISRS